MCMAAHLRCRWWFDVRPVQPASGLNTGSARKHSSCIHLACVSYHPLLLPTPKGCLRARSGAMIRFLL